MNQKQRQILLVCVSALIALTLFACSAKKEAKTEPAVTAEPKDSITITLTGRDSVSVFALLTESHQVDFVSSAMGVFIKAIDSVPNGANVYWMFSVNDTMAQVSADKLVTHTGDRIVWHFRAFSGEGN